MFRELVLGYASPYVRCGGSQLLSTHAMVSVATDNCTYVHRYVAFDYHTECKGGKFENLSLLMEEVQGDFSRHGYVLSTLGIGSISSPG